MLWARHPTDAGTPDGGRPSYSGRTISSVSGDCHPGPTASLLSGVLPPLSPWVYLFRLLSRALQGPRFRSSLPQLHSCKARKRDRGQGHTPCSQPGTRANDGNLGGGQGLSRLFDLFSGLGTSSSPSSETMVTARLLVLALPSPARGDVWVRGRSKTSRCLLHTY